MKDFFKPEDFEPSEGGYSLYELAANIANEKLNELIKCSPTIYNRPGEYLCRQENATHRAKMMFIEEIKKEPCNHEPILYSVNAIFRPEGRLPSDEHYRCKHCGVELVAEWSEKK